MRIEQRPLPTVLPDLGDLPPLLTRIYAARGVANAIELEKGLARLLPTHLLKGMDAAVQLLAHALEQRQRILIVGDFDADGGVSSRVFGKSHFAAGDDRIFGGRGRAIDHHATASDAWD